MAIIKRIASRATSNKIVNYLTKEEKTEEKLISGKDCTPEYVVDEFNATKELYNQNKGVMYHHIVQSFSPEDNIKPEKAHELGKELAEKQFKNHEVLIVTHIDKNHIHNHLVVNSVDFENGKKYKASNKSLWDIKRESNKQCERENLKTIDLDKKASDRVTTGELRLVLKGQISWKDELRQCIDLAKDKTKNIDEFSNYLKKNLDIDTRITNKTISYKHPQKEKSIRGSKLGNRFDKEDIENGFIRRAKEVTGKGYGDRESTTYTREYRESSEREVNGNIKDIKTTERVDESIYQCTHGQRLNDKSDTEQRDKSNRADIKDGAREYADFITRAKKLVEQQSRENTKNVSRVLQPDARTREEAANEARELKQANSEQHDRGIKISKSRSSERER